VYLLANHYAKSYRSLETSYQNLEKIVTVRTSELTTTNTIKNRLLSVMSHDVKSPLNSLRDILHLYNKGEIKEQQFQKYIQQLENDLVKTTVLVENVLFWTSRQLKGIQIKFERFDVRALLEENIELFETVAANKHIRLHHDMEKDLVIKSDRNILNFVLRNLLSNAIKFSHEEGSVELTIAQADEFLSVQIKDHGVGMDEHALQTLLSPGGNASTTGTVNEKGTGLGLALCREYLLKAGGELTVESAPNKGSTFSFLLPMA
jgi:signal transduction histidine kinase